MKKNKQLQKLSNFVIFKTEEGKINIDVFFAYDTLWLTQKVMAELFDTTKQNISLHLKNIFKEDELNEQSVVKDFSTTAADGKTYQTQLYSLDAIIAVGYRVNSKRATKFRIWATEILREFIVKGFAIDDERLKQIQHFGKDYFEEMLERIREIRASERRFYQKITDIYSLSADYDKDARITKAFFANVQNKLHWAITGKTAAEIIYSEADAKKAFMGLKTWRNAYLDLAENRASRGIVMNMKDWVKFLNHFLELSSYPILSHKGNISAEKARLKADGEYEKFRGDQDKNYVSDFDREVKKLLTSKKKKI